MAPFKLQFYKLMFMEKQNWDHNLACETKGNTRSRKYFSA